MFILILERLDHQNLKADNKLRKLSQIEPYLRRYLSLQVVQLQRTLLAT